MNLKPNYYTHKQQISITSQVLTSLTFIMYLKEMTLMMTVTVYHGMEQNEEEVTNGQKLPEHLCQKINCQQEIIVLTYKQRRFEPFTQEETQEKMCIRDSVYTLLFVNNNIRV